MLCVSPSAWTTGEGAWPKAAVVLLCVQVAIDVDHERQNVMGTGRVVIALPST